LNPAPRSNLMEAKMEEKVYEFCNNFLIPDRHTTHCTCCKKCGAPPSEHELRDYSMLWHDGDVYCRKCGSYVRMWDAG